MCIRCREIERDLGYLRELHADTQDRFATVLLAETIEDLQSEISDLHHVKEAAGKPNDPTTK